MIAGSRLLRSVRLELRLMTTSLRRGGSRAALALVAMAVGIGAMMLLLALGAGARREFEAINDQLGSNQFTIKPALVDPVPAALLASMGGSGRGRVASASLDHDDVALLRQELAMQGLTRLAPVLERSTRVRWGREVVTTSVRGVGPEFADLRGFHLAEGRGIEAGDGSERRRVAVVGSFVAAKLALGARAPGGLDGGLVGQLIGQTLWVGGVPFEVVGLLTAKGTTGDAQNEDDQILVPIETARSRLWNVESLSRVLVSVDDDARLAPARRRARELLRRSHRLDEGEADDFEILELRRNDVIRQRGVSLLRGLSGFFAALTLGLAGIGVLSVTWLDVRERTPEIGLRRALGARRRDIGRLFAGEACVLSAAGGAIGLILGGASVVALRAALGWPMVVEAAGTAVSFAISVGLGLAFGIAPALKAARVPPIDALRDA